MGEFPRHVMLTRPNPDIRFLFNFLPFSSGGLKVLTNRSVLVQDEFPQRLQRIGGLVVDIRDMHVSRCWFVSSEVKCNKATSK